jgi:plasmid stability protein
MAVLVLHDIPDADLEGLDARAARHGRTREAEARQLIHEAAREELLLRRLEDAAGAVQNSLRSTGEILARRGRPGRRYTSVEPTPRYPRASGPGRAGQRSG